jgi:hypothetical protein
MTLIERIKHILVPKSYPEKRWGISDAEFFCLLLECVPEGSRLDVQQDEPESWVHALRHWSSRAKASQLETDWYTIDSGFVQEVRRLIGQHPDELDSIHHVTVISPTGERLLSGLDNFTIVDIATWLERELDKRVGNQSP